MAAPSQIPGHPLTAAVDSNGNAFASGTTFYLSNVCSGGQQILTFDSAGQEAITKTLEDVADRKWTVEYEGGNRNKVAFKNSSGGGYLAATGPGYGSKMWLSDSAQWWYVYQGAKPNTFWFGTTQSADAYLHTWDCSSKDQAKVQLFTNRDSSSGRFFGMKYTAFEELTTGLSWSLKPAPDPADQSKPKPQPQPQAETNKDGNPKTADANPTPAAADKAPAAPAAGNADTDANAKANADAKAALEQREAALAQREKAAGEREERGKQAEAALQRQQEEVSAREEKAAAAEKRLKKVKGSSGPADLLAAHQEADRLRDELAKAQGARDESAKEVGALQAQVEALRRTAAAVAASQQPSGPGNAPPSGRSSAVIMKKPLREPQKLTPPVVKPAAARPAKKVPSGFTPALSQKMDAGKKSLASLRERRPPQAGAVV